MDYIDNNLISYRGEEGFSGGSKECCAFSAGFLRLLPDKREGSFTGEWMDIEEAVRLVMWWNGVTPAGSTIEPRARIRSGEKVSEWQSWGIWSSYAGCRCSNTEDDLCSVDADTLTLKDGEAVIDAVQLQVILRRSGEESPLCFGLGCTYREKALPVCNAKVAEKAFVEAPLYSQMVREPDMAHVMCSAVTATVLMNRFGLDLLPEQTALVDYDVQYGGYGNWAFTMAAASAFGFETYLLYAGLDRVRYELSQGRPVGMNVRYSASFEGKYPYLLHGACPNTAGHLLTLTGYFTKDGTEWFVSHDSAAEGDENCCRFYRADQLAKCSSNILYILKEKYPFEGPFLAGTLTAEAEKTGENEYFLVYNGGKLPLPADLYEKRLTVPGGGVIACAAEEDMRPMPKERTVVATAANRTFLYGCTVSESGAVHLGEKEAEILKNGKHLLLYVVLNTGTTYRARI